MIAIVHERARSMPHTFLTADWRHLLMVNYEVDPSVVAPLVPHGLSLDFRDGRTFVSLVGFQFLRTRVLGLPVPFHVNFVEVNLRFYVIRNTPEGARRGVTFVREVVPRWAIAAVARGLYHEPYVALPMQGVAVPPGRSGSPGRVHYSWHPPSGLCEISASIRGNPQVPSANSEASWIAEHYWGYTRQPDDSTAEYEVRHPPWRIWQAEDLRVAPNVISFYGSVFEATLSRPPVSAFVAEGSSISVHPGHRLHQG